MKLEGSCHCGKVRFSCETVDPYPFMRCYCSICRKTAGGGGYAINIDASAASLELSGEKHLAIYRAVRPQPDGTEAPSTHARFFCKQCGTHLYAINDRWPDHLHPLASAIDTPLPEPPEHVHIMLGSKAPWVSVEGTDRDQRFDEYPDVSLKGWHEARGLLVD